MATDTKASGSGNGSGGSGSGDATALPISDRLKKFTAPTVWHEFTPLAQTSKAVNLGQGFPGWSPPEFVTKHATDAINPDSSKPDGFMAHQYSRSAGDMTLCQALSDRYSKALDRKIDPITEIVTTNGATEAIFISIMALCNPGDEVVTIEPAFDIYSAQTDMAGAVLRTVPLRVVNDSKTGQPRWTLDLAEFERAFTDKTRLLLLNTPHNPTGKVFTRSELEAISSFLIKKFPRVTVIADEVYSQLTYESPHVHIATVPGMYERTISIGSAGKMFSVTGWKIGWCVGPPSLIRCLSIAHQWDVFSVNSTAQIAIAKSLVTAETERYHGFDNYWMWLREFYRAKRARLAQALIAGGIKPIMPEGGFFIMGDTSALTVPTKYTADKSVTRDWALCRWLTVDIGVAAIPPSSFYAEGTRGLASQYARFAFCKPDSVLDEAAQRLTTRLKPFISGAAAVALGLGGSGGGSGGKTHGGSGFSSSIRTALSNAARDTFITGTASATADHFYDVCRANGVERFHYDVLGGSATFYSRTPLQDAKSGGGDALQSFRFATVDGKPEAVAAELDVSKTEQALKTQHVNKLGAVGVAHIIIFFPGSSGGRALYFSRVGDWLSVDSTVSPTVLGNGVAPGAAGEAKSNGPADISWSDSTAGIKTVMHESLTDTLVGGFPKVVKTLMEAQVESYWVDWTHETETLYSGVAGQTVAVAMKPHVPTVATPTLLDVDALKATIKNSQNPVNPQTYLSFMKTAQAAGSVGYSAFLRGRRVIYWGRSGQTHTEWFPGAAPSAAKK